MEEEKQDIFEKYNAGLKGRVRGFLDRDINMEKGSLAKLCIGVALLAAVMLVFALIRIIKFF